MFFRRQGSKLTQVDQDHADYALIPIEEYNGYEKAVRIVRDRSLQQIDKTHTDEHGYTPLRADLKPYKQYGDAWLVTKRTPYSTRIDMADAAAIIERDLRDFYHFRRRPIVPAGVNSGLEYKLSIKEILDCFNRYFKEGDTCTSFTYRWLDETAGQIILEMSHVSANMSTGCYEVSYWATCPM